MSRSVKEQRDTVAEYRKNLAAPKKSGKTRQEHEAQQRRKFQSKVRKQAGLSVRPSDIVDWYKRVTY